MPVIGRWLAQVWSKRCAVAPISRHTAAPEQIETLIRAQGNLLALLAVILERENIINSDELARSLRAFAAVTAADRPAEGDVLSVWASCVRDAALMRVEPRSVQ